MASPHTGHDADLRPTSHTAAVPATAALVLTLPLISVPAMAVGDGDKKLLAIKRVNAKFPYSFRLS